MIAEWAPAANQLFLLGAIHPGIHKFNRALQWKKWNKYDSVKQLIFFSASVQNASWGIAKLWDGLYMFNKRHGLKMKVCEDWSFWELYWSISNSWFRDLRSFPYLKFNKCLSKPLYHHPNGVGDSYYHGMKQ